MDAKYAAMWLIGVQAAFRERGIPRWIVDRNEFFHHIKTATQVAGDGAFNPLCIWEMQIYVEELSKTLTPPLRFLSRGE